MDAQFAGEPGIDRSRCDCNVIAGAFIAAIVGTFMAAIVGTFN